MRPNDNLRRLYFLSPFVCIVFVLCNLSLGQQADREPTALPDAPKQSAAEQKSFFSRWANFSRQDFGESKYCFRTIDPPIRVPILAALICGGNLWGSELFVRQGFFRLNANSDS